MCPTMLWNLSLNALSLLLTSIHEPRSSANLKHTKIKQHQQCLPEVIPRDNKLDLLVTDVLGPLNPDIHGNRFLLTICDHANTYFFVFSMKSWAEFPIIITNLFKKFISYFKTPPKFIRCDNAKEYTIKSLHNFLSLVGSQIIFTSPYTPDQNGKAKCLNQTLGNIAWTTLTHSQLPSSLWSYAYKCTCYLVNRLSETQCKTSLLELWSDRIPTADTFYPFDAWASVHKSGW
jgi:hypothetical protein